MSDRADILQRPAEPAPRSRGQRLWQALDERLGLSGLQYPIPEHANKLAYSLGGLSLICLSCWSPPGSSSPSTTTPTRPPPMPACATSSPG
jgi:hypothetical protein